MDGGMAMLPDDLPEDMPSFLARFGSDEQCREYLFKVRWQDGFRCAVCGHGDAYALKTKIVYECVACRKQHSLLAGTIFEQTKTGLAKWFLAIYLVTSSKGGIAATELKRQLGFGSYQTAWSWLHKIRKAMLRPDRQPLAGRVEADETHLGAPKPGRRGRGAAGKTLVAGAVETGRGKPRGRRLGRLRLAVVPDASAKSLGAFLAAHVTKPATVATDGWSGYRGLPGAGYGHEPINLSATWGDAALQLPGIHLVFGLAKRWLLGTHHGAVSEKHLPAYLDEYVFRFNRRTAKSISHGFARLVEHAARIKPTSYRDLVATPHPA
jgi:transposase-like protein